MIGTVKSVKDMLTELLDDIAQSGAETDEFILEHPDSEEGLEALTFLCERHAATREMLHNADEMGI